METYNTRTSYGDIRKVEGKKIILEGYPKIECYGYDDGFVYYICDFSTGTSMGNGDNQKSAKLRTIENLRKVGIGKFRKMVEESIKEFGYANN